MSRKTDGLAYLPGYKKTPLGLMPSDWKIVNVADVGEVITGNTPPTNDPSNYGGDYLFVSPADLGKQKYVCNSAKKLSQTGFQKVRPIKKRAILFTCIGATIGKMGIAGECLATNQQINSIICSDEVDNEFIYYELLSKAPRIKLLAGTQAVPILNKTEFQQVPLLLPPYPEQKRISAALCCWDRNIELTEKLIAAKIRFKGGLMQQLLTGKKQFQEFEEQKWQKVRIADLFEEVWRYEKWDENALYNLVSIRRRGGGLFSRGALLGQQIKVKKLKSLCTGDFLISKRQVVHGAWGLVTPEYDGTMVSDEYDSLIVKNPNQLSVEFFTHLSRLPLLRRMAALACNGVHIEKLIFDWDDFSKNFISIPSSVEEQRRISAILDSCDKEVELLKRQLDALKRQKRGLMQKLLTGQIRVKVDETEAVTVEAG